MTSICVCGHEDSSHMLCTGQCCECTCEEFDRDEFDSFLAEYQNCAANCSFPKLTDSNAFEPMGRQPKQKGKN